MFRSIIMQQTNVEFSDKPSEDILMDSNFAKYGKVQKKDKKTGSEAEMARSSYMRMPPIMKKLHQAREEAPTLPVPARQGFLPSIESFNELDSLGPQRPSESPITLRRSNATPNSITALSPLIGPFDVPSPPPTKAMPINPQRFWTAANVLPPIEPPRVTKTKKAKSSFDTVLESPKPA